MKRVWGFFALRQKVEVWEGCASAVYAQIAGTPRACQNAERAMTPMSSSAFAPHHERSLSWVADAQSAAKWLFFCCAWLVGLVIVGGITRLTHSGLSITEWQPLVGTLPPLNEAAWQELFSKYQATPEYRLVNSTMTLTGFREIFWWEWTHRFLARGMGFVYAAPLVYFLIRRRLGRAWNWRLSAYLLLGGGQGLWGWLMVKSGLEEQPWVSPVRLAGHLGLAFFLFLAMFASALELRHQAQATVGREQTNAAPLARPVFWLLVAVFGQALIGALVAGLRAGLIYNSFPTMNGQWIPQGMWLHAPWWLNLIDNGTTVQFAHRIVAGIVTVVAFALAWRLWTEATAPWQRRAAIAVGVAVGVQVCLGILTLLMRVPVALGVMHQVGALILMTVLTYTWKRLRWT